MRNLNAFSIFGLIFAVKKTISLTKLIFSYKLQLKIIKDSFLSIRELLIEYQIFLTDNLTFWSKSKYFQLGIKYLYEKLNAFDIWLKLKRHLIENNSMNLYERLWFHFSKFFGHNLSINIRVEKQPLNFKNSRIALFFAYF